MLQEYLQATLGARKKGRQSVEVENKNQACTEKLEKLVRKEAAVANLAARIRANSASADGFADAMLLPQTCCGKIDARYSRRYAKEAGVQGLSKAARAVACHAEDWDIQRCMFTLATQIVDQLRVQFPHNAASFSSTKAVSTDLGGVANTLKLTNAQTKELCLKVFNGGRIPEEHRSNPFLQQLRCEGILLGWVSAALQPDLHDEFVRASDRRNPEATCWFYLWTMVEDFILDAWLTWMHQNSGRFHHIAFILTVSCSDAPQAYRRISVPSQSAWRAPY